MKLGSLAGGVCRVCGSDTYGADIGCSCKKLVEKAKYIALKAHSADSLEFNFSIRMRKIMDTFVCAYEKRMEKHGGDVAKAYRTAFNREFFPSVYNFYKAKGYVSKKQLDVVERKLSAENEAVDFIAVDDEKARFLDVFARDHAAEIIDIAQKLWREKK